MLGLPLQAGRPPTSTQSCLGVSCFTLSASAMYCLHLCSLHEEASSLKTRRVCSCDDVYCAVHAASESRMPSDEQLASQFCSMRRNSLCRCAAVTSLVKVVRCARLAFEVHPTFERQLLDRAGVVELPKAAYSLTSCKPPLDSAMGQSRMQHTMARNCATSMVSTHFRWCEASRPGSALARPWRCLSTASWVRSRRFMKAHCRTAAAQA